MRSWALFLPCIAAFSFHGCSKLVSPNTAENSVAGQGGDLVNDRLSNVEREMLVQALKQEGGNQTRAAERLGITRRALIYRMAKHGIES
jgi:DNA-binding NtrC family response regulator